MILPRRSVMSWAGLALSSWLALGGNQASAVYYIGDMHDEHGNVIRHGYYPDRRSPPDSKPCIRELLVTFLEPAGEAEHQAMADKVGVLFEGRHPGHEITPARYQPIVNRLTVDLGKYYSRNDLIALVDRLREEPEVKGASMNGPFLQIMTDRNSMAPISPDDFNFTNGSQSYLWGAKGINATYAWPMTEGSANITIAIVDTGRAEHEDVTRWLKGYDFIRNDTRARDTEFGRDADSKDEGDWSHKENSTWHGLQVGSISGADSNNGIGLAGMDWQAKLLPVRVAGVDGADPEDLSDAIVWSAGLPVQDVPANPNRAKVINLSLGDESPKACSDEFQDAINRAVSQGATVVVSAGNKHDDAEDYPLANCQNVIVVTAIDKNENLARFANYGRVVDIAAPGVNIVTAVDKGTMRPLQESFYQLASGTSQATPHVSGTASLMLSVR